MALVEVTAERELDHGIAKEVTMPTDHLPHEVKIALIKSMTPINNMAGTLAFAPSPEGFIVRDTEDATQGLLGLVEVLSELYQRAHAPAFLWVASICIRIHAALS